MASNLENPRTLNYEKVLECRSKIVKDQTKLIGSDLKSIFTGTALINWLMENLNPANNERTYFVKLVQDELFSPTLPHQFIYPVEEGESFKDSEKILYRFVEDQFKEYKKDRTLLNLYGNDTSTCQFFYEAQSESVLAISEELKKVLGEIYDNYLDETKKLVDYARLEESEIFNTHLIPIVTKLAFADMSPLLHNPNQIKAFFINIYNTLTIHSVIARFRSKNKLEISLIDRPDFYISYKYNIGGHNYTLNDISQGLFRKNCSLGLDVTSTVIEFALKTKARNDRFSGHDPRLKFVLSYLDPRIHFSISPASLSGCILRYYSADEVDTQLDLAARDFCDRYAKLKVDNNKAFLEVHEVFKFYIQDFARNESYLMNYIWSYKSDGEEKENLIKYLEEGNIQFKYLKTEWDLNKIIEKSA